MHCVADLILASNLTLKLFSSEKCMSAIYRNFFDRLQRDFVLPEGPSSS